MAKVRGAAPETAGSQQAGDFSDFYAANFRPLCLQLYAHTGSILEAQDVVQEAFCRALSRWERIAAYDDPAGWVRRVAWNLATSRWRKWRRFVEFSQHHREEFVPSPDPAGVDLRAALARLPATQRQAVILHHAAGLSLAEIATVAGVAEGTVKSRLHRARSTLAKLLGRPEERDD